MFVYTVYDVCVCVCVFCVCCVCSVCVVCVCLRAHVIVVNIVPVGASVPLAGRKVQPSRQLGSLTVGSALHCCLSGYADVNPFISTIIWHILVFSLFPPSFCWHMKIKGRSLIVTCGSDAVIRMP